MSEREDTIDQLADIVVEYLIDERYDYISIAAKLRMVTGNQIATETCHRLANELEARAPSK